MVGKERPRRSAPSRVMKGNGRETAPPLGRGNGRRPDHRWQAWSAAPSGFHWFPPAAR